MSDDLVKQLQNPRPMSMFLTRADQAKDWTELLHTAADRIEELEAKLAMAVDAADRLAETMTEYSKHTSWFPQKAYDDLDKYRATIAELKGDKDE